MQMNSAYQIDCKSKCLLSYVLGAVAELVEHGARVRVLLGSNAWSSQTYSLDASCFLVKCSELLEHMTTTGWFRFRIL